mmetsp:Transcript_15272/g.40610  ORF Transcript_15272/g.40610 Transcript_15272/m.40610 type:complete len:228 (-) Transcript_15272:382-1065(-)
MSSGSRLYSTNWLRPGNSTYSIFRRLSTTFRPLSTSPFRSFSTCFSGPTRVASLSQSTSSIHTADRVRSYSVTSERSTTVPSSSVSRCTSESSLPRPATNSRRPGNTTTISCFCMSTRLTFSPCSWSPALSLNIWSLSACSRASKKQPTSRKRPLRFQWVTVPSRMSPSRMSVSEAARPATTSCSSCSGSITWIMPVWSLTTSTVRPLRVSPTSSHFRNLRRLGTLM